MKTKFSTYTFICDFILPNPDKTKPDCVLEVDGRLHEFTWKGKPAVRRKQKDEVKQNCLEAAGYNERHGPEVGGGNYQRTSN